METRTILRAYQKTVGRLCYADWSYKQPTKMFSVLVRQHTKFYLELCRRIDKEQYDEIIELVGE